MSIALANISLRNTSAGCFWSTSNEGNTVSEGIEDYQDLSRQHATRWLLAIANPLSPQSDCAPQE